MLVPAHILRDLLVGTVLAASKDFTLPVLTTVHLSWESVPGTAGVQEHHAGELVATSTDRYRMHEGRTTVALHDDEQGGQALVDRRDVEAVVKALPKPVNHRGMAPDAAVRLDGDKLVVECGGSTHRLPVVDATFPKVAAFWPADDNRAMVDGVTVNPAFVADLAKVPTGKGKYWTWNFTASTRGVGPALVRPAPGEEHPAIAWRALVMPVTLPTA